MNREIDALFQSPALHYLAGQQDQALFLRMDRNSYYRSVFLDARAKSLTPTPIVHPLKPLLDAAGVQPSPPPPSWIFHMAHCGSTLLAKALDRPGSTLVLREPPPLRQLGIEAASGRRQHRWETRLSLAHKLASRRFEPDEQIIIKANVPVNFLIEDIVKLEAETRAIFLYFAFEPYLLAVLRTETHKTWVERLSAQIEPALVALVGECPARDTAERAARRWLAQIVIFNASLETIPGSLNISADRFFADPFPVAEAAARHFGVSAFSSGREIDMLMAHYSKEPDLKFSERDRRMREDADRSRLAESLERGRNWLERSPAFARLPVSLPCSLFGELVLLL